MLNIYWFRKDLRLEDNRGLCEFLKAAGKSNGFLFLYIKNRNSYNYFGRKRIGFLYECLSELSNDLNDKGFRLVIAHGTGKEIFNAIAEEYGELNVYCNAQVEPYCRRRDEDVMKIVESKGGKFFSYTDSTIFEGGEIRNLEGNSYRVFTAFRNNARSLVNADRLKKFVTDFSHLQSVNETIPDCISEFNDNQLISHYDIGKRILRGGRIQGLSLLNKFAGSGIAMYKARRDIPGVDGTSRLSAYLHFGSVGVREAFRISLRKLDDAGTESERTEIETWINELLWREFYYDITFNNPSIAVESFNREFDKVKWNYNEDIFKSWCDGKTGFPIVDAGMRQLNDEGWMHNRVRMITAMFLTKDLLIDWRLGEKYFAENLIDMDFSNNNGGWQWSASTGVDAQPYFRIFNPVLQSKRFDPEGNYIRKYVPELSSVKGKFIHEPHTMSMQEQQSSGVIIGKHYPAPIVDHSMARAEAIKRFKEASGGYPAAVKN